MPLIASPTDLNCIECGVSGDMRVVVAANDTASFEFGLCRDCALEFSGALRSVVSAKEEEAPDA